MYYDVLIDEDEGMDEETDEVSVQSEENGNSEAQTIEVDDDVGNYNDDDESEPEIVDDEESDE